MQKVFSAVLALCLSAASALRTRHQKLSPQALTKSLRIMPTGPADKFS